MRAVILAGGLGTRMRPLTYTRPKPLLPLANKPHIEHALEHLGAHGIDSVVLTTSYMSEAFDGVVERSRSKGLEVVVTTEEEPLDTAGAIKNAERWVSDATFLVVNVDILTKADLTALVQFHHEHSAAATILLTPVDDASRYGVVATEDDGSVTEFIEKPPPGTAPTNNINAGVYVMEPSVVADIASGRPVNIEREVFPPLARSGTLYAQTTGQYWIDIGTPPSYLRANADVLEWEGVDHVVGDGAEVSARARVSSASIGDRAVVGDGAVIHHSILLPGATVGDGAIVRESVIGEGGSVAPGAEVVGTLVADGDSVEEDG